MDASDLKHRATPIMTVKPLERSKASKLCDCFIILIIMIIAGIMEFQLIEIKPNKQYIPGVDTNYNFAYPDKNDTISDFALIMIVLLPWFILFIISTICLLYFDKEFSTDEWKMHFYLMSRMFLFCFAVNLLVTDLIKLFVGSPRPYFLSVYNENENIIQIRLSFPSGHASQAMASSFLLAILMYKSWKYTQNMHYNQSYIIGMRTYNPHAYYLCGFWWMTRQIPLIAISFVFIPIYFALWCSLTRITDYKHFAADVVAGMILGSGIAYSTYLIFYNEMYISFDYRLNTKICQLQSQQPTESNNLDQNEDALALKEIVVVNNRSTF